MSKKSKLWTILTNQLNQDGFSLENFRDPEQTWINSKLASWKPNEESYRWYKSFVLAKALLLDENGVEIYQSIKNTTLGKPVGVRINKPTKTASTMKKKYNSEYIDINLDYLLVVEEITFLENALKNYQLPETIVEIGAGFGRTCHGIMSKYKSIARYEIIDLPEMLQLSQSYLQQVLTEKQMKKVHFISAEDTQKKFKAADLCIQIDALQEMESETIEFYFSKVVSNCSFFFSSNPIAKYLPEHAGLKSDLQRSKIVFSLGRSRDIADIWDLQELEILRNKHTSNYQPKNFSTILSKSHRIFPHYENSFYKKNS
jgi:putative sugar O-methyltransferase